MSKGLKALEKIKNAPTIYVGCASDIYTRHPFECKDIEKELKALEIIKKRKLVVYDEMSKSICTKGYIHDIPQEECDLLKEVLL